MDAYSQIPLFHQIQVGLWVLVFIVLFVKFAQILIPRRDTQTLFQITREEMRRDQIYFALKDEQRIPTWKRGSRGIR